MPARTSHTPTTRSRSLRVSGNGGLSQKRRVPLKHHTRNKPSRAVFSGRTNGIQKLTRTYMDGECRRRCEKCRFCLQGRPTPQEPFTSCTWRQIAQNLIKRFYIGNYSKRCHLCPTHQPNETSEWRKCWSRLKFGTKHESCETPGLRFCRQ